VNKEFQVHVFEKLPVPFGLIRYGVAPDHQKIKNCQKELSAVANNPNFKFFANVNIGRDLTIPELE
jgi:NADPH-dependent glutamate synthase beta subunit-like oxidoreductase